MWLFVSEKFCLTAALTDFSRKTWYDVSEQEISAVSDLAAGCRNQCMGWVVLSYFRLIAGWIISESVSSHAICDAVLIKRILIISGDVTF